MGYIYIYIYKKNGLGRLGHSRNYRVRIKTTVCRSLIGYRIHSHRQQSVHDFGYIDSRHHL